MQPVEQARESVASGSFIFFDIEVNCTNVSEFCFQTSTQIPCCEIPGTSQEPHNCHRGQHLPVLIIALKCCDLCKENIPRNMSEAKMLPPCSHCGPRFHKWDAFRQGPYRNIAIPFVRWLFSFQNRFSTAVAHNLKQ